MKEQSMSDEKPMGQVIQIDEARIRDPLGELVRGTVEETLNAMRAAELVCLSIQRSPSIRRFRLSKHLLNVPPVSGRRPSIARMRDQPVE
jgi:hypothetical protein